MDSSVDQNFPATGLRTLPSARTYLDYGNAYRHVLLELGQTESFKRASHDHIPCESNPVQSKELASTLRPARFSQSSPKYLSITMSRRSSGRRLSSRRLSEQMWVLIDAAIPEQFPGGTRPSAAIVRSVHPTAARPPSLPRPSRGLVDLPTELEYREPTLPEGGVGVCVRMRKQSRYCRGRTCVRILRMSPCDVRTYGPAERHTTEREVYRAEHVRFEQDHTVVFSLRSITWHARSF